MKDDRCSPMLSEAQTLFFYLLSLAGFLLLLSSLSSCGGEGFQIATSEVDAGVESSDAASGYRVIRPEASTVPESSADSAPVSTLPDEWAPDVVLVPYCEEAPGEPSPTCQAWYARSGRTGRTACCRADRTCGAVVGINGTAYCQDWPQ